MELQELHTIGLALLREVDSILKENNIWYSLAYGCVLGAVREKGFIAWDRDIDVVIRKEDQPIVRKLLKEKLSDKFHLLSCAEDVVSSFDTVYIQDVPAADMHMDIYPLIGGPDDEKERFAHQKKCRFVHRLAECKYMDTSRLQKKWKLPLVYVIRAAEHLISDTAIRNYIDKLGNKYPLSSSNFAVPLGNDGKISEFMEKDTWLNVSYVPFEDTFLPIPTDSKKYLTNLYGEDYMTPKQY